MFQLLVSISLDAFEQGRQRLLLFLAEEGFVFFNVLLERFLCLFGFLLLHLLALELQEFGLFVSL